MNKDLKIKWNEDYKNEISTTLNGYKISLFKVSNENQYTLDINCIDMSVSKTVKLVSTKREPAKQEALVYLSSYLDNKKNEIEKVVKIIDANLYTCDYCCEIIETHVHDYFGNVYCSTECEKNSKEN